MKPTEIKFKNKNNSYSILIGNNILKILPKKIKVLCPDTKKIALIFDSRIPLNLKINIKKNFKSYEKINFNFNSNEKVKSLRSVDFFLNKLLCVNYKKY